MTSCHGDNSKMASCHGKSARPELRVVASCHELSRPFRDNSLRLNLLINIKKISLLLSCHDVTDPTHKSQIPFHFGLNRLAPMCGTSVFVTTQNSGNPAANMGISKMGSNVITVDDWYWAADVRTIPVGDRFIIENGQEAFWRRVRREIEPNEHCNWSNIQRMNKGSQIEDILDMMIIVVPIYGVNHNRFMFEAAKIPVFAQYLYNGRSADLCNYVSNSLVKTAEPYSDDSMRKLGRIVSSALGRDADWF